MIDGGGQGMNKGSGKGGQALENDEKEKECDRAKTRNNNITDKGDDKGKN